MPLTRPRTWGHEISLVTPATKAIYDVPAGARWRGTWCVRGRATKSVKFMSDREAARWCREHGLAFPEGVAPSAVLAWTDATVVIEDAPARRADPRLAETVRIARPQPFDHQARAAGDGPEEDADAL